MSPRVVLLDGVRQADGQVRLDADDQTLLLGRGVFETLRTYDNAPYRIHAHLRRLRSSAQHLGIAMPPEDVLAQELCEAVAGIQGEAVVRVTLTHGGHRVVRAAPLPAPLASYRCATRQWTPPPWMDGSIKHTSRGHSVLAVEQGEVDEVIWTDTAGHLLEGTRSNIFAVIDGVFCTPPLDGLVLAGVTRADLLEASETIGVPSSIRAIHHAGPFEELYLCSTLKELSPISMLDGQKAPGAGPVGERVSDAFQDAARSRCGLSSLGD